MLKVNVDMHLIKLDYTILGKEYNYKSKGGRIFVLILLLGLVGRHFGLLNWPIYAIVLSGIAGCLIWDAITLVLFRTKINKETNKTRYVFELSGEKSELLHISDEEEHKKFLLVCDSQKAGQHFIKCQKEMFPEVEKSTFRAVTLSDITDLIVSYEGLAVIDGDDIILRYLADD